MLESTTVREPDHPCDEVVTSFTPWFPCRFEENFPLISSSLFWRVLCFPDTTNITTFPPFPSLPISKLLSHYSRFGPLALPLRLFSDIILHMPSRITTQL